MLFATAACTLGLCAVTTALAAQIPMPGPGGTNPDAVSRGFYFRSPTTFTVTHLQVADEMNTGRQNVALYRLSAEPPQEPRTVPGTPVFFASMTTYGLVPVLPPVTYQTGEWVGVLGICGFPTERTYSNTGVASFASRVLNHPITLTHLAMRVNIANTQGVGPLAVGTVGNGRVRMFVTGQGKAVTYGDSSGQDWLAVADPRPPSINQMAEFQLNAGSESNLGGTILVSQTRASTVTPFGTLLVGPAFLLALPVPPVFRSVPITFRLPNDTNLLNTVLTFQGGLVTNGALTLTNGLEWTIGL